MLRINLVSGRSSLEYRFSRASTARRWELMLIGLASLVFAVFSESISTGHVLIISGVLFAWLSLFVVMSVIFHKMKTRFLSDMNNSAS